LLKRIEIFFIEDLSHENLSSSVSHKLKDLKESIRCFLDKKKISRDESKILPIIKNVSKKQELISSQKPIYENVKAIDRENLSSRSSEPQFHPCESIICASKEPYYIEPNKKEEQVITKGRIVSQRFVIEDGIRYMKTDFLAYADVWLNKKWKKENCSIRKNFLYVYNKDNIVMNLYDCELSSYVQFNGDTNQYILELTEENSNKYLKLKMMSAEELQNWVTNIQIVRNKSLKVYEEENNVSGTEKEDKCLYEEISTENNLDNGIYIDLNENKFEKNNQIKRANSDSIARKNKKKEYDEILIQRPRTLTSPLSNNCEENLILKKDVEKNTIENEIHNYKKNISILRIREAELSRYLSSQIENKLSVIEEVNKKLSLTRLDIESLKDKIKTCNMNKSDEGKPQNYFNHSQSKTKKELNVNEEKTIESIKKELEDHSNRNKVFLKKEVPNCSDRKNIEHWTVKDLKNVFEKLD